MMNERWYQEAIKERAIPVLTLAWKESLSSEKNKWVISITQEVVDASGQKSRSFAPRYWLSESRGLSGSSPTWQKRL